MSVVKHKHRHFHQPEVLDCYSEHNRYTDHVDEHTHNGLGSHNHDGYGHTKEQLVEAKRLAGERVGQ